MDDTKKHSESRAQQAKAASSAGGPPPTGGAPPSSASQEPLSRPERDARVLDEVFLPSALHSIINLEDIGPLGAKAHVENFIRNAGSPADPVEGLLLQMLLLVHHRLVRLHEHAARATGTEAIKILNAAAARLTSEYRRLALALKAYRAPVAGKSVAFIRQQNVAQEQQVHYRDGGANQVKNSLTTDSEVASKDAKHEDELAEILRSRARRAAEPAAAGAAD